VSENREALFWQLAKIAKQDRAWNRVKKNKLDTYSRSVVAARDLRIDPEIPAAVFTWKQPEPATTG